MVDTTYIICFKDPLQFTFNVFTFPIDYTLLCVPHFNVSVTRVSFSERQL